MASLLAIATLVTGASFAVQTTAYAAATHATIGTSSLGQATLRGSVVPGSLAHSNPQVTLTTAQRNTLMQDFDWRMGASAAGQSAAANNPNAPTVGGVPAGNSTGVSSIPHLQQNFDALYGSLNSTVNPVGDVEPPDQGLCVGPNSELELINDIGAVYNHSGNVVAGPFSLGAFFNEPVVFLGTNGDPILTFPTDPRCYYEPTTHTYYASMLTLGLDLNTGNFYNRTHLDLAVNTSGDVTQPWKVYYIDSTNDGTNGTPSDNGCPCLGDQPLLGVSNGAVYLSTNEFPLFANGFNGAHIYAIDKSQLLSGASTVTFAQFEGLTIGGSVAASIQPATNNTNAAGELFLNALDPNATTDNRIGVWAMTNEAALDSGLAPTLSQALLQSEAYGQPPVAAQKGSSATLNTDDDRMQQVTYQNGALWSSLDTAINVNGDTATRSGAAWFEVTPQVSSSGLSGATIDQQGYVAVKGAYLLYPAVATTSNDTMAMVATLSGDSYYPSAVYSVKHGSGGFRALATAGQGLNSEQGFTCLPQYGGPPCRWGDYSAVAFDPGASGGLGIWMATEYVANDPNDGFLNYSTRLFEA